MIGVQESLDHTKWRVVLYDGNGCFVRDLWTLEQFDWRLAVDRLEPDLLYTRQGSALVRYDISTGRAAVLKDFRPLAIGVAGPSLSQTGDRILITTSDGLIRSYRLPDMGDERTFQVTFPPACKASADKWRYVGYRGYVATGCDYGDGTGLTRIYTDAGTLVREHPVTIGHADFTADGWFVYPQMWTGQRGTPPNRPLQVRAVGLLDGASDRAIYSIPASQATYVRSLHATCPRETAGWCVAAVFPSETWLPPTYAPPLDEVIKVFTDGGLPVYLARTEARVGSYFWAEPLPSPSADGSRISFNSNRSGTIDQFILWMPRQR